MHYFSRLVALLWVIVSSSANTATAAVMKNTTKATVFKVRVLKALPHCNFSCWSNLPQTLPDLLIRCEWSTKTVYLMILQSAQSHVSGRKS